MPTPAPQASPSRSVVDPSLPWPFTKSEPPAPRDWFETAEESPL